MFNRLKNFISPPGQTLLGDGSNNLNKKPPMHPDPAEKSAAYKQQGDAHLLEGNLDDAKACYQHAIALNPNYAKAHSNLGFVLKEQGAYGDAERCLKTALSIDPKIADAHYMLGTIAQIQGKQEEAIRHFRMALKFDPDLAFAYRDLCFVLFQQGQIDEAKEVIAMGITHNPGISEYHYYLGDLSAHTGEHDKAAACYRTALSIQPAYVGAHFNLGIALREQGNPGEAIASFQKAIALNPGFADAHLNLGNVLLDLDRFDEAEASCRRVLQINPGYAEAHIILGFTLQSQGRLTDAEASFRRALQIKPDFAEAHCNLGVTLYNLGRLDEAEASYRRALAIKPDFAVAYLNLSNTLKDLGRLDEAEASYRRALQIKPDFAEAYNNLGNALEDLGKLDDAIASYRRALQIKPDYAEAHSNLLFSLNYATRLAPSYCLTEACQYGRVVDNKVTRFAEWLCVKQPNCLRIGLVSGDFRNHPVGYFLESLLSRLDPASVEIIAYPTDHKADELTARIKPHFAAWKPLFGLQDEAAARLIHGDGIHVLLDLSGHTAHNRLPIFAWKPAPVQTSWLGYFATTGVATMDYLIADPWTLLETEEAFFTEKIWRMPETRLCFTLPDVAVEVSPLPSLSNGHITFGCFNNLVKMNDDVVALWARVLKSVPDSRLFLKAGQLKEVSVQQNTINRFAAHGISRDRLILEGFESRRKYFAAYHRVDIALDPFPYPGGTTSIEGLWMGVPVLTLAGERFLSRQGVGLLMNAGLPEWIASDADDYAARAVSHAADQQRLAALRSGLRQQVLASPLFNAARFARHFEDAIWGMWERGYGKAT